MRAHRRHAYQAKCDHDAPRGCKCGVELDRTRPQCGSIRWSQDAAGKDRRRMGASKCGSERPPSWRGKAATPFAVVPGDQGLGYAYAGPRFDTGAGGEMFRWDGTHGSSGSPIATRHSPAVASKGYQFDSSRPFHRCPRLTRTRRHRCRATRHCVGLCFAICLPLPGGGEEEAEQTGHEIRPG